MAFHENKHQNSEESNVAVAKSSSSSIHFQRSGIYAPDKCTLLGLLSGHNVGGVDRQFISQAANGISGSANTITSTLASNNIITSSGNGQDISPQINAYNNVVGMESYFGQLPSSVRLQSHPLFNSSFFMLPKTGSVDSYGLSPSCSAYATNYYQASNGYPMCPNGYSYYFPNDNPEPLMLNHNYQPLNLTETRMHLPKPRPNYVNSYGELINHHGYVGLNDVHQTYHGSFPSVQHCESDERNNQCQSNVGSPEVDNREETQDNFQLRDNMTSTSEGSDLSDVVVAPASNGIVDCHITKEHESSQVPTNIELDVKPKRKRGRPRKIQEMPHHKFDINSPQELLAEFHDEPPSNKLIKPNSPIISGSPTETPIIRTPDSSVTASIKIKNNGLNQKKKQVGKIHLSEEQIDSLEAKFDESPFLSDFTARVAFANKIKLNEHRIAVWFQNRRTKERRAGRMPPGPLPDDYNHHKIQYNPT